MSSEELKPCNEPQAHPDRCGCQPDAFQIARHSKRLVEQQRERIAALEAERERLRAQVSALQSDANSWQSGYDKGREDGAKAAEGWKAQHARDSAELRRLCAERDQQWRIRRDVEADRDTANAVSSELRAQRDALAAELEAIKGQEPVAWRVTGAGGLTVTPEYPKWAEDDSRLLIESLYTAPQPAPAQDVAGWIPVTERLPEVETDVLVRGVRRNEVMHRVAGLFNGEWSSQETEDLLLGEVTHWMPLPAAPAAHDKQSGVE